MKQMTFEKKLFRVGDNVEIIATGEKTKVRKVVKASYYCFYVEGHEGYFCSTDLIKAKRKEVCNAND